MCMHLDTAGCSTESDPIYRIAWPSTETNMIATNNCPDGYGMNDKYI